MCSLALISSLVVFLGQLVFSISIPTDDLGSNTLFFDDTLVFDSTQPSSPLFTDDNEFWVTDDAILSNPCAAAQDDLSFTQEETNNIFSRDDGAAQCLPPVNIGADPLQLFEMPLDSLESIILPLQEETPDDPFVPGYPGRLPDGEKGDYDPDDLKSQGWQPFTGAVHYEPPDSPACREISAYRGNFRYELCCNGKYVQRHTSTAPLSLLMTLIENETTANQDIELTYDCIRTCFDFFPFSFFFFSLFLFPFSFFLF